MSKDGTTINVEGLDGLIKALKTKAPKARVGIINKNGRNDGETNATIGAAHEFGTSSIPQRSFLRVPIATGLKKEMEKSKLLDKDTLKAVVKGGSIKPWLEQVCIAAEACVARAFATGGDGKWPAWKNPNYENNTGDLLVDTQQLRESIAHEVKD